MEESQFMDTKKTLMLKILQTVMPLKSAKVNRVPVTSLGSEMKEGQLALSVLFIHQL